MTVFVWTTTRDHATNLFRGDTPGAALEQQILHHYEREPQRVIDAIDQIGRSIERGGPNAPVSGWAVLAKNLSSQPAERVVTDEREKAKHLALAEQWITNTGGYLDRDIEILDELFSSRGRLQDWPELWHHIKAFWEQQRPRFIAAEAEALERQYALGESYKRLRQAIKGSGSPIDTDLHAGRIAQEVDRARYGIDPHRDDYIDQLAEVQAEVEAA